MGEGAILLAVVTLQRGVELLVSSRNETRLRTQGAVEFGRAHYLPLVALHTAWLGGLWLLAYGQPVDPTLLALFVGLQFARLWVLFSLGPRWTTRILVLPGKPLVARGPYRFLRHPNYLVVIGEIAIVPLALGLPLYAALFSILNALMLLVRIGSENAALAWATREAELASPEPLSARLAKGKGSL